MKPPQRIDGKYEVLGELARGGMGVVFRARDVNTDREVALKLIQGGQLTERQRERFQREGVLAAGLDHPGIVRVHASGEHDGQPFLVQELVPQAQTLEEVFRERSLDERVALVLEAARAVGHAHTAGVIHRDLKPANLLVGADGRVRVADFGLAHRADLDHLTKTGELLGTPTHMAPEQFNGAVGVEAPATDVWALGVTLYQALTGELPFQGATLMELAERVEAATPSSPRNTAPQISPQLEAVCLRALRRHPADRFPDAAAFAKALEAAPQGGRPNAARWVAAGLVGLIALVGLAHASSKPSVRPTSKTSPEPQASTPPTPAPVSTPSSGAPLRLLARHVDKGAVFSTAWLGGRGRIVAKGEKQRIHLFRLERRAQGSRLVQIRRVDLEPHLQVITSYPTLKVVDLLQGNPQPWVFANRTTDQLFAGARLQLQPDVGRDMPLTFAPGLVSRATGGRYPRWALTQAQAGPDRQVHVLQRGPTQIHPLSSFTVPTAPKRIQLSPNGRYLAITLVPDSRNLRTLCLYEAATGKRVWRRALLSKSMFLRFSPSDATLVVGTQGRSLLVFAPPTDSDPKLLRMNHNLSGLGGPSQAPLRSGTFARSGRVFFTLSGQAAERRHKSPSQQSLRCYDTATWKELPAGHVQSHTLPENTVATSPDDRYLLVSGTGALELYALNVPALLRR